MRHYFRTFAARFGNVLCRNAQQQFNRRPFASAGAKVVGGGATMLSLGFFGAGGKKKQQEETKLPGAEDLVIREADMLYDNYLIDNAYNLLRRYRSSNDSEFLWRLARVLCEQGKQTKNAAERKRLYSEALEYAEKAVKCEPTSGSFGAHKWYAIILNYNTELEGTKAQLTKAMDVKTHFERALELNPLDATTWHLLGLWHYSFANLSTYERWGASLIYSKPPQSTVEEALRHFERAEAINPNFYSANNYYLGLCYERQNRRNEALDQLTKAFIAPVITMDDRQTHEKALLHLRKNYKINEAKLVEEQK